MNKEEAVAEVALFDLKRKEELLSAIRSDGRRSKIFDHVLSGAMGLAIWVVAYHYSNMKTPSMWDTIFSCIMIASVFGVFRLGSEVRRMDRRINALVRLLEIERNEDAQQKSRA